jgi:formate hydrogenlyase subunit 3/multisubunit Na+/H+ antiporter MnhD subunit
MSDATLALPGPLFFALFLLAAGVVSFLVHRWTALSGLVAAAGCLALGWIGLRQTSGQSLELFGRVWVLYRPFVLLGREWAFTTANLSVLTLVLSFCGLAFLLALPAPQGWSFYPFGMGVLASLTMAATAQQFFYSILFYWLAAILAVFVLSGGRPGATAGAVRFLVFTSLAVMPLLTLPSYLAPDATPGAVYTATVLMVIGFAMLLMVVPFHGQLVAIAAHSAPMVPAFMLSAFPPVVFHLLFSLGRAHPLLLRDQLLFDVCRWLGTAAVIFGGMAAAGQRRWGYLVGCAALVDWGCGLVAFGQGTQQGIVWAMRMLIWRSLSLLLVGAGLTVAAKPMGPKDDMAVCGGLLQRRLLGVSLLVIGLFSLAGFPLTPGAAGRWPQIMSLLAAEPRVGWVLILAGVGVAIGTLAGVRACLGPVPEDAPPDRFGAVMALSFALLAGWFVIAIFLHPTPWIEMVQHVLGDLPFLAT